MSELAATLREAVAALAASDRTYKRFGAATHRYELAPPRDDVDPRWPSDLRELVTTFASGGAGPYHGFTLGEPYTLRDMVVVPVGHVGCGYAAAVELATGAVWIDARAIGVVAPMHPSFTAYYLDWIDRLAHHALPRTFVPPGACALAAALGGYLGVHEQRLGLAPGTISGDELAAALAQLGPGAIAIAAQQSPLFPDGTAVPPCLACAQVLANLGLALDVVR